MSGGNTFSYNRNLTFRPSFGNFLERNFDFLAKISSLDFLDTFVSRQKYRINETKFQYIAETFFKQTSKIHITSTMV